MKSLLLIATLLPVILASDYCLLKASFEINNRITTECKVPASLTTGKDVETLKTLCTPSTNEEVSAELKILTAKQTEFGSRGICSEDGTKTPGLYTWITWRDFQIILRPLISELNEENFFVGRDATGSICKVNLTTATCVQDEKSIDVSDVLLERLPVAYELTNIIYDRWRNVTFLDQIVLTSVNLTNIQLKTEFVEALVRYDFEKKINITLFSGLAAGVPIILHEDTGTPSKYTVGEITKKMQSGIVSVVKRLPAKTSAIVRVVGTETLSVIHMSAKLTTIYARDDQGVDKIEEGDIQTTCIESGVMDVRPEETVSIHIDPPVNGGPPKAPLETTKAPLPPIYHPPTTVSPPVSLFQSPGPIYPAFKTFSTIGAVIFFSVFIIAMTDVARKIIQSQRAKDRRTKRKY